MMIERYSSVMAKAWARADEWNALHLVGTKVRVFGDTIQTYETFVRGVAAALPGGRITVALAQGPIFLASLEQLEPL